MNKLKSLLILLLIAIIGILWLRMNKLENNIRMLTTNVSNLNGDKSLIAQVDELKTQTVNNRNELMDMRKELELKKLIKPSI